MSPRPLNYSNQPNQPPFPKSICTSVNHVVCHGIPSDRKVLRNGDVVNIDTTVVKDGWHGDTRQDVLRGQAQRARAAPGARHPGVPLQGIEQVRPGAFLGDVGAAIQRHAQTQRFSVVREFGGHGIGQVFHDEPMVLHYGKRGTGVRLEPGMTFTIEPMINAGKRNVKMLPDQWTVVTKDHRLSAQWEHTVLVTDGGVEVLTRRAEEAALAPAA